MDNLRRRIRLAAYFLLTFSSLTSLFHILGGFEKELKIDARNATYSNIDDSSQGGDTQSVIDFNGNSVELNCDIGEQGRWPFCEISVDLNEITGGLDLSSFHSLGIDVDYFSLIGGERLRIYLRNFDPAYSTEDDPVSYKFNAIEYAPGIGNGIKVIPFKSFQVLSWWIADYEVPIENSGPQFDNIVQIEIATGSHIKPAHYSLKLNRLVFYGHWLSESALLRINILLWIMTAIYFLVVERRRLAEQVNEMGAKADYLKQVNQQLYQQSLAFEQMAFTDNLTGTQNRHAVDRWLRDIVDFSQRNCHALSLAYIDIDFFKRINDTLGHHGGDEVLKEFGRVLNLRARKTDVVVRWGGEEFIIFCPATNLRGAREFAEMVREIVESYQWANGLHITCSIGVAEYLSGEEIESFIQRADSALYKAKSQGRNRVEEAQP
ncbi:GGDEF domain-containing protein [Photobacterium rosenbergii]|uniref:diguanylate cyclase n=1 Tax=Photobacterium rosenbergii TaxID=294936 RepID=A0ABU3ZG97_9GAMM|nr:GGDEF domain-containing protein [Photobacterium rosenbergii]MDV5168958.1 GGDEF domain-containing protein [Photobacterium rosenbergii]